MKKNICFNGLVLLVCTSIIYGEQKSSPYRKYLNFAAGSLKAYGAHMITAIEHELGHLAACKLALIAGAIPHSNNPALKLNFSNYYLGLTTQFASFHNNKINAAVNAAGPIAALIGIYCSLKLNNIYNSLSTKKNIKESIHDGLKKSLINQEQSRGIQVAMGVHLLANIGILVPFKIKKPIESESHGYKICKDLGLV